MTYAAILRSPHAHARITSIDTSAACGREGVVAVFTGADTEGVLNGIPCAWQVPESDVKAVDHPPIAKDVVSTSETRWRSWWRRAGTLPRTRSRTST